VMLSDHQQACPLVYLIAALEPVGWRVVELRPSIADGEASLWRVTIERHDQSASMNVTDADPDVALAELARYAQADAKSAGALVHLATVQARRRAK
jgi:hypothetical protein